MAIRAIETTYKGYRFRSRLEARWAVFLDVMGVSWEYEPDPVELRGGTVYLVDFRVPAWRAYVEIKGVAPTDGEVAKAARLAEGSGTTVLLVSGPPWRGEYRIREFPDWDWERSGQADAPPHGEWDCFAQCRKCDGFCVMSEDGSWHDIGFHDCGVHGKTPLADTPRLRGAYDTARGIRFDRAPHLRRNGVSWSAASGQAVVLLP